MSDTKIQDTPAVPDGAKAEVLSTDADNGRVKGGDFNQNQGSFCRGTEVPAGSSDVASRNRLNDGAAVRGIAVSVKMTSANHLEGSSQGDHRAHAAPAVLPPNPAPREGMTQTPNGKFCR